MTVKIKRAGFLTTVQDIGRTGHRASGVSLGGALDTHALRIANLLVGNEESAAGLEFTLGTAHLAFEDDRLIAWCGGPFDVRARSQIPAGHAARIRAGVPLILAAPAEGARVWLAISGGIDLPLVLGSRSTDLRGGFGGFDGRALRDGDALRLGDSPARLPAEIAAWSAPDAWSNTRSRHGFLRIIRGVDWSQGWSNALTHAAFTVTADSDRMGVRLEGPELRRESEHDLISEAVVPGTIQVPPSGQPIVLLGDCQTIGGYPKIAHVITVDLPAAAQLRPGDAVRFAEVSLGEAQNLLLTREDEVEWFRAGVKLQAGWS